VVLVKLKLYERLTAVDILPKEGGIVTLRLIRDLTQKLGPSADELREFEVKQEGNTVTWGVKGNEDIQFDLKEKEQDLLKAELEKLDKAGKLEMRHYSLYNKIFDLKE